MPCRIQSSQLLASARAAHAAGNVHAPRGSLTLGEVAGEHSMAKRMQATADFNATHPNVFRVKPMVKPGARSSDPAFWAGLCPAADRAVSSASAAR